MKEQPSWAWLVIQAKGEIKIDQEIGWHDKYTKIQTELEQGNP